MKNMNSNKFMMLLVLAVGSMSQVRAYEHHNHRNNNNCPSHKEHEEIRRIEDAVHNIRRDIKEHGAQQGMLKELDMLHKDAQNLCESCNLEKSHVCQSHENTLLKEIKTARELVERHHKAHHHTAKHHEAKENKKHKDNVHVQAKKDNNDNSNEKKSKAKKAAQKALKVKKAKKVSDKKTSN